MHGIPFADEQMTTNFTAKIIGKKNISLKSYAKLHSTKQLKAMSKIILEYTE